MDTDTDSLYMTRIVTSYGPIQVVVTRIWTVIDYLSSKFFFFFLSFLESLIVQYFGCADSS